MPIPLRVLIIEDSAEDAELMATEIEAAGFQPIYRRVETRDEMMVALTEDPWDVAISDYTLPRFSGAEALAILSQQAPQIPLLIVSGTLDDEQAVVAMRQGASDYLLKDRLGRLGPAIKRALDERKREEALRSAEERLRQAQKMEAIGLLAGGVAHDFNNLLTVISGFAELGTLSLPPEHQVQTYLAEILQAGEQAALMTQQLLAFSRRQVLQPVVLNVNSVVQTMERILRRLIGEDIELTTRLDPALGRIRADPGQVEQIILNLTVNARDAMPDGGQLIIETANVELAATSVPAEPALVPGPCVSLSVSDTGVGMPPEVQSRIFEPFFTTKPTGQGTGLGLSTVYGIVQQSGGTVHVYSELGHGTTLRIYFPRWTDDDVTSAGTKRDITLWSGTERILLVEDDPRVREMARTVLESCGYTVIEATCPEEALARLAAQPAPIDLLATDVVMPGMSGPDLAQRLAIHAPELRVLYMSGYTPDIAVRRGLQAAGVDFLGKPFTPITLAQKVREVLDRRRSTT